MFAPVFFNTDHAMEADFMTFVTFRQKLKSILRHKFEEVFLEKPDKSITTKKLMQSLQKHVGFSGVSLKSVNKFTNAASCGSYMAELTYMMFTMLAALNYEFNVSKMLRKIYGIVNDAPKTGKAIYKIIYALNMFEELAYSHECFEVLDVPTCIDVIESFLEKSTTLVVITV